MYEPRFVRTRVQRSLLVFVSNNARELIINLHPFAWFSLPPWSRGWLPRHWSQATISDDRRVEEACLRQTETISVLWSIGELVTEGGAREGNSDRSIVKSATRGVRILSSQLRALIWFGKTPLFGGSNKSFYLGGTIEIQVSSRGGHEIRRCDIERERSIPISFGTDPLGNAETRLFLYVLCIWIQRLQHCDV